MLLPALSGTLHSFRNRQRQQKLFMSKTKALGKLEHTGRGFEIIHFEDRNGVKCTLQASSLAVLIKPGTSALWLGSDEANPRMMVKGIGWQPVPMPEDYITDTRMHLDREHVKALIRHLQNWLNKGTLGVGKNSSK